jgi:uncharacterized protein YraI
MGTFRRLAFLIPCALLLAPGCSGAEGGGEIVAHGDASSDATADATADAPVFEADDPTGDLAPDAAPTQTDATVAIAVGANARVTANSLNLRSGAGTSNSILLSMPCGSLVAVVGGPSASPTAGWWNVRYAGTTGWASGTYLVAEAAFDPAICSGGVADGGVDASAPPGDSAGAPAEVTDIITRAKGGVGYSYYWGHGSWSAPGGPAGTCSGSCPSCSHTGQYGADCSGFVAKCWQVPSPSPITTDLHPYSTYNFVNDTTHWTKIDRKTIKPADALTYNTNGAGHIMLFESGTDPFGSIWTYEARGCSYGIVHNLRTAGTQYIAIRREGL